jgi:CRP/FNR family transcriptional regulator, cyclic AMP receptor protein
MSPEVFYSYLRQYFAAADLSEKQIRLLQEITRFRTLKKGERIFYSGSICRLYLLLNGRLKLVDCADEEHQVFKDIVYPGNLFGDIVLSDKTMPQEYIEALTNNAVVGYCFTSDIRRMIMEESSLAFFFAITIAKKLKRVQRQQMLLMSKDAKARLIHFLQNWAKADGVHKHGKIIMENYLTLNDIAEYIGTTRQTLYTLLKELKKQGLVYSDRRTITIDCRLLHFKDSYDGFPGKEITPVETGVATKTNCL